jgi:hypothetical protein
LKYEEGKLFISEGRGGFERLDLGETPEATALYDLLRKVSSDGSLVRIPVDRRIVADGGVGIYRQSREQKKDGQSSKGR